MGYYMSQGDSSFVISPDKEELALKALRGLAGNETIKDASGHHFSRVRHDWNTLETLDLVVRAWRWQLHRDEKGQIYNIDFQGQKLGDDFILFHALAPYVKTGSFIEMLGEGGDRWRWYFKDGKVLEQEATITYE